TDPIAVQAVSGGIASLLMLGLFALSARFGLAELDSSLPNGPDLNLLALAGVLGTVAHLMMTWSLRYAPASTLASMQYLEIPMAVLVGWLVFSELPNLLASCGIALTMAAGLYAVLRERQAHRARPAHPALTESGLPASPE
ncbi:DMT family transporter, partial [Phaeobacter sp. HF9A]|uniref:DMT family transporter n=1 Tax=Phaeobacter sp. HF9A TaxID=2721561 RepID=UPI001430EE71